MGRKHILLVDNGNLSPDAEVLDIVTGVMAGDGYEAVGTGEMDIRLAGLFSQYTRKQKLRVLRATARGDALDAIAQPLYVRQFAGHRVGVTAAAPVPPGQDPAECLGKLASALAGLRAKCDFLVLLSQLGLSRDRELAARCAGRGPQAIVPNMEGAELDRPEVVAKVAILPSGPGGTRVGVAEIEFPALGQPHLGRVELLPGKAKSPNVPDPRVRKMVVEHFAALEARFLRGLSRKQVQAEVRAQEGGADACARCHPHEINRWKLTKHSRAMATLETKGRIVAECVVCHSTRFRATGVFDKAARTCQVGCASCHPPAASGGATRCAAKAMPTQGQSTCSPCHTLQHSPRFNYVQAIVRVDHHSPYDPLADRNLTPPSERAAGH